MIPKPITDAFTRLIRSSDFKDVRDVLLLECQDASTGLPVYTVCLAMATEDGGTDAVPIAIMVSPEVRGKLLPPTTNLHIEGVE